MIQSTIHPLQSENLTDIEKAAEIALYYGFIPLKTLKINNNDKQYAVSIKEKSDNSDTLTSSFSEEKFSLLRHYIEHDMRDRMQPIMVSYSGKTNLQNIRFNLDIIGSSRSVSEALLIKTAIAILEEDGYKNTCIHINSFGDKDSFALFERELLQYCRKNIADVSSDCRQAIKEDPFNIFTDNACGELRGDAPQPINFLSEKSRVHFKQVLEYLESIDVPYKINHHLFENRHICSETIFEIRDMNQNEKVLARGIRYNTLVKKMGLRRDLPAVGLALYYKRNNKPQKPKKTDLERLQQPKIYFVQLGFEAKLKSFRIIEELRRQSIPLYHALTKDKCAGQINTAENLKLPYMLVLGIKEAMEDTIIVREMSTRSQKTIPISQLSTYLRRVI